MVAEWDRGVRDVKWGGGEEALAMDSGNTGSPQTKFSFLSPPDMAASDGKLTTVNWPY